MGLNEALNHYDILEITPNASPQDVREAYVRTRATYNRSNIALYSIVSPEEREDILKKIEDAYFVLSDPERRRDYDSNMGILGINDSPFIENLGSSKAENVISIDRVPPMETHFEGDPVLIPPSTDFAAQVPPEVIPSGNLPQEISPISQLLPATNGTEGKTLESPRASRFPSNPIQMSETPPAQQRASDKSRSFLPKLDMNLTQEIEHETEWKGPFLRKIREAYKISLEEMISTTKVSKTYILAIEDENFAKLPAPVYIRGFVTQIAKVLKLPHERVASAYLERYRLKTSAE